MILDEFLIALGVKADTKALADVERGLENVEQQAENTDKSLSKFSGKLGTAIKGFAGFAVAAAGAIKGVMVGAWAYLDSTMDKVEELQTSEDLSLRTTKEQVAMAKKYRENMEKMGKTIENVKTRVALAFLPAMLELSNQYATLIDNNKELIANGISKFLIVVSKASQVVTNFVRFIKLAVESTIGWRGALIAITAAFVFLRSAMILAFVTNPITWVVAAIVGLLLLIDDFMTYLRGGKSEFGEYWGSLIKWINKVKAPLKEMKEAFLGAWDAISTAFKDFIDAFSSSFNLSDVFGVEETKENGKESESVFLKLIGKMKDFFNFIKENKETIRDVAKFLGTAFAWAIELVIGLFNGLGQAIGGALKLIGNMIGFVLALLRGDSDAVVEAWNGMVNATMQILQGLLNVVGQIIDSILQMFGTSIAQVGEYFKSLLPVIQSVFSNVVSYIQDKLSQILSVATSVVSSIGSAFSSVFDLITSPFSKAFDFISSKWEGLKSMFGAGVSVNGNMAAAATNAANRTINNVSNTTASIQVNGAGNPQAVANNVQKNINATASRNQGGIAKA